MGFNSGFKGLNTFAVGVHVGFGEIKSCIFHIASEIS